MRWPEYVHLTKEKKVKFLQACGANVKTTNNCNAAQGTEQGYGLNSPRKNTSTTIKNLPSNFRLLKQVFT